MRDLQTAALGAALDLSEPPQRPRTAQTCIRTYARELNQPGDARFLGGRDEFAVELRHSRRETGGQECGINAFKGLLQAGIVSQIAAKDLDIGRRHAQSCGISHESSYRNGLVRQSGEHRLAHIPRCTGHKKHRFTVNRTNENSDGPIRFERYIKGRNRPGKRRVQRIVWCAAVMNPPPTIPFNRMATEIGERTD